MAHKKCGVDVNVSFAQRICLNFVFLCPLFIFNSCIEILLMAYSHERFVFASYSEY